MKLRVINPDLHIPTDREFDILETHEVYLIDYDGMKVMLSGVDVLVSHGRVADTSSE